MSSVCCSQCVLSHPSQFFSCCKLCLFSKLIELSPFQGKDNLFGRQLLVADRKSNFLSSYQTKYVFLEHILMWTSNQK